MCREACRPRPAPSKSSAPASTRTRPAIAGPPSCQTTAYPVERTPQRIVACEPRAIGAGAEGCCGVPATPSVLAPMLQRARWHETRDDLPRRHCAMKALFGSRTLRSRRASSTTGLVDTVATPILMQLIDLGKLSDA